MNGLAIVIAEIEADLGAFMPPVRNRILRRVKAAYWLGVSDGHTLAPMPNVAERRSQARDKPKTAHG